MFGDSRNPGTPMSYANRDQRDVSLGFDYGKYSSGMLAVRAFDGRQIEEQLSTAMDSARSRREIRASLPRSPATIGAAPRCGRVAVSSAWKTSASAATSATIRATSTRSTSTRPGAVSGNVASGGAQSLSGAFVQALFSPVTPLHIELSARVDRWDNTDGHAVSAVPGTPSGTTTFGDSSKNAFSPRAGIRYQVTSNLSFHAAYYRAFRAPNLAELYRKQVSPSSITLPNPFLEVGECRGPRSGLRFPARRLGTGQRHLVRCRLQQLQRADEPCADGDPSRPAECGAVDRCRTRLNVNKSRSEGGEAYIALRPIQQLFVSGSVNYDDDRQQSGLGGDRHRRQQAAHQPRAVAEADDPRDVDVAEVR